MKNLLSNSLFILAIIFGNTSDLFAHALWFEKNSNGNISVCYGEYAEGVREKKGERLDTINVLEVWNVQDNPKVVSSTKAEDRFIINESGNLVAQATQMPVKDMTKYNLGIAKPHLYARFVSKPFETSKSFLKLDILPSPTLDKAQVVFSGMVLAKQKVILTAPNGWIKELETDADGWVSLTMPWTGLYVAEVTHVVEKPGSYEGQTHEVERHRATLSLEKQ